MKYSIAYYDSDVKFSGAIFEDTLAIAFGYEGNVKKIMDTYRLQNPIYFGTYENLQDAQQAYWRAKEFDEENNELEIVELNGSEKWVFRDYYQESLNFLKGEGAIGIELLLVKIFRNKPDIKLTQILQFIWDSAIVYQIGDPARGVKFTDLWEVAEISWQPPVGKEKIYEYIDKVVWLYHFHSDEEEYEEIREGLLEELYILRQLRDE